MNCRADPPAHELERLRIPLHSDEAEQSVLGGLLLDNSAWSRATELLENNDFYRSEHQIIYCAIGDLITEAKSADVVTVFDQLQRHGRADACGGLAYLNSLRQSVPSASNMRRYAEIVRERSVLRRLVSTADQIAASAFNLKGRSLAEVLGEAELKLAAVGSGVGDRHAHLSPPWVRKLREWVPRQPKSDREVDIRHAVSGLIRTGKVGALVAAGGTGKTTLEMILAICHATGRKFFGLDVLQGSFVLLSNDDPQEDLEAALALVVKAMQLTESELEQVARRVRLHSLQGEPGVKTFTSMGGGTVLATGLDEMLLKAFEGIPDLVGVAIDTLRQFSGGNSNDEQVIKHTIAGATEIARRTKAYVILSHHTGKQNYRDGVADMYCGSGSAAIADNCRFVLLLQTTTWAKIKSKVQRTGHERGDPLVLSSTRGSLLMKPAEPIFLHRDGFFIHRVAGAGLTQGHVTDERDREVLRAVRGGAQSKNAVAERVGGKKDLALKRVDDLERRGLLSNGSPTGSLSRPQYVVTADGARFLDDET